jgi:type IV pilus assembly protein PilE
MKYQPASGFSLIEVMIVVVIVGILAAMALPSYNNYVIRSSRAAAQTELLQLAGLQEKIYLNSNAYTASINTAYNGTSAGGLGETDSLTEDHKYVLSVVSDGQTYTLNAAPVAGSTQEGDGNISVKENGERLWNGEPW